MTERIYLDWNATAPLRPQARAAMLAALDLVGNASSVHAEGRGARKVVEEARSRVAALVGAQPKNVTFTSGGTEANAMALSPVIEMGTDKTPRDRLLMSAIEHPSVRSGGRFAAGIIEDIPVTAQGVIDLEALRQRLAVLAADGVRRPLVFVMAANNETGVVQPIPEVAAIVHEAGGLLHVDAVQTAGRIPCDIGMLDADALTLSAHKIGGPKGVGALICRSERIHFSDSLVRGGGQERGLRAGTENVAGIAGFGAAAALARESLAAEAGWMAERQRILEAGLLEVCPDTVIFGKDAARLPNTTLFAVAGIKAETAVIALDLAGCAVSSGAACSSGKVQPSHVLMAMGVDPALTAGALRLSLGWTTTDHDIEGFLFAWRKLAESLLKTRNKAA